MSLEIERWVYEGPQWDNVVKVIPIMFKSCEKTLLSITTWLKEQRFDEKFTQLLKQLSETNKRVADNDRHARERHDELSTVAAAEFKAITRRLDAQEANTKRIEASLLKRLSLLPLNRDDPLLSQSSFSELDHIFNKYFPQPERVFVEETQEELEQQQMLGLSPSGGIDGSGGAFCTDIDDQLVDHEALVEKLEAKRIEYDESYQFANMQALWRVISACVHECYLNQNVSDLSNRIDRNHRISTESTQELTQMHNGLNDSLRKNIQSLEMSLLSADRRIDILSAYDFEGQRLKLAEALEQLQQLAELRNSIASIDSKVDGQIASIQSNFDELKTAFSTKTKELIDSISVLKRSLQVAVVEQEKASMRLAGQLSESSRILNDQLNDQRDYFNDMFAESRREKDDSVQEARTYAQEAFDSTKKTLSELETSTNERLKVLANGLTDVYPRIKDCSNRLGELSNDITGISMIQNATFADKLREKMSSFIISIWSKADKTQSAVEKLIDSLLDHQNQLNDQTQINSKSKDSLAMTAASSQGFKKTQSRNEGRFKEITEEDATIDQMQSKRDSFSSMMSQANATKQSQRHQLNSSMVTNYRSGVGTAKSSKRKSTPNAAVSAMQSYSNGFMFADDMSNHRQSATGGGGFDQPPSSSIGSIQYAFDQSSYIDDVVSRTNKSRAGSSTANHRSKVISFSQQEQSNNMKLAALAQTTTAFVDRSIGQLDLPQQPPYHQQQLGATEAHQSTADQSRKRDSNYSISSTGHPHHGHTNSNQVLQLPDNVFRKNLIEIKQRVLRKQSLQPLARSSQQQSRQSQQQAQNPFVDSHVNPPSSPVK